MQMDKARKRYHQESRLPLITHIPIPWYPKLILKRKTTEKRKARVSLQNLRMQKVINTKYKLSLYEKNYEKDQNNFILEKK